MREKRLKVDEVDVALLRAMYPNPQRSQDVGEDAPESYCVGGTLFKGLGIKAERCQCPLSSLPQPGRIAVHDGEHAENCDPVEVEVGMFPDPEALGRLLCQANPLLSIPQATLFARLIVRKNDTGNFQTAWTILADALEWTEGTWSEADDTAVALEQQSVQVERYL